MKPLIWIMYWCLMLFGVVLLSAFSISGFSQEPQLSSSTAIPGSVLPADARKTTSNITLDIYVSADGKTSYFTNPGSREIIMCFPPCQPAPTPSPTPTATPIPTPSPTPLPAGVIPDDAHTYPMYVINDRCELWHTWGGEQIPGEWPVKFKPTIYSYWLVKAGTRQITEALDCGFNKTITEGIYNLGACDIAWDVTRGLTGIYQAGTQTPAHATAYYESTDMTKILPGCGWTFPQHKE